MNKELRLKAKQYAHDAHDSIGQTRKYSGEPYWVHTDEVGQLLWDVGESDDVVCAGFLHDVKEDIPTSEPMYSCMDETELYSLTDIYEKFNENISNLVEEVTNVFESKIYPYLNRKLRKECEHARLASCSAGAHSIKYADIISNLKDWKQFPDKGYLIKYVKEKKDLLDKCKKGHRGLYNEAYDLVLDVLQENGVRVQY